MSISQLDRPLPQTEQAPPRLRQPEPCRCPVCKGRGRLEVSHSLNVEGEPITCPACKGGGQVIPPPQVELTWRCGCRSWMPWRGVALPVQSLAYAAETTCEGCRQGVTRCAA